MDPMFAPAAQGKRTLAEAIAQANAAKMAAPGKMTVGGALANANGAGFAAPAKQTVGGAATTKLGVQQGPAAPRPQGAMSPAPTVPTSPAAASEKMTSDLMQSPFRNLKADWQGVYNNRMAQMRADIGEQRAAQERAARVQANQRGLMSGGNSALAQGQQARIAENAAMMSQRGGLMIANDIDNQARDYDMRLAGAEAAWRQGVPAALAGAMLLPGNVQAQGFNNQALAMGNEYARRTMDSRVGVADQAYTTAHLQNEIAGMDVRQRQQLFDTAIAQAKAEGRITEAEAQAAQQMQARNEAWWNQPWAKDILRIGLIGAGAGAGFFLGGPAGAMAGGGLGANFASGIR